ncbi:lactate utilization protein [Polaribacter litorisediminis]|uniref:lactate utilization protein n=1 Tax=Polaribacter litorisediminis TaxID=1908341 RepID=UPI001CBE1843|nr:lactate utilization protein [Polaribacter litorisediminis]UAM98587.1 lactate utilization protein [Polaribacter litorisediminis]
MSFFKKLFGTSETEDSTPQKQDIKLDLDDLFVHKFVKKGGKFLYCASMEEVIDNFKNVILENNWSSIYLLDKKLSSICSQNNVQVLDTFKHETPIFTTCEHLIADNGDILFSSNQLKSTRLQEFPDNFIVFATTSQLVKDTGQGLTGIKVNRKSSLPTNICAIKNYRIDKSEDNFLNYGNNNSKNLYLLLLEDL